MKREREGGGRGEGEGGGRVGGGDQSNEFKLLIISIKALQDINPVRLLMCV